ncbi:MAG: flippase-like domain-containing protein [Paludibacteraceae bacterium]|nr:flippase-like domain-containing protein [Prevotella sp.]MBQ8706338.1 flippase-like domain-containing protein [Paludibacteraceae bacterium]MBQ8714978.1 flippase-like domain-containing protein [Prevotella sp.]
MKWTKQRLNNLFFFLGIAAIVVMLLTFDVSFVELWDHLCHAGYWLIPIIGVWIFVYALNALAWQSIIEGNIQGKMPVSFWRLYRLTITGYALNYATPVGGLGGEPYRIMELSKDIDKEHATSSVILYAMMHFFAHFWFWFISIFIYLGLVLIGDLPINVTIGTTLGIIVIFCLFFFYLFSKGYRNGLVKYVLGVVANIPGLKKWTLRFWARHSEAIENIDKQIAALYGQDTRAFYRSLLLEYFSRVVQSSEVMFMLLLFGIDCGGGWDGLTLTFLHSILIVAFTTLFANLIGFLPMQLGVQEGGFVLSIAALGLSAALGIFVSIICRVREIIWIAIGMLLMKWKN